MKKTFTILIAAIAAILMMTQPTRLWGQTRATAAYKTLSFPDDNNENNHVGSYTETWTATSGSDSWSISNFNNNNWNNSWTYIKCGRKGNASTGTITTSFAIDKPVKSVTINIGAITSSNVTSISLYKSSDGSNWGDAVGTFTKGTGEKTVTISSPTANLYYKIEAVCTSGSGNGLLQINWVKYNVETFTVTYNSNGGSGTMTDSNSPYWTGSTVTTKTNTFTAPSGKVFNHWNTASDDSGSSYTAGASFTITANTTLYAIWSNAGDYINVDPTTKNVTCAAQNAEFTITTDQTLDANPVHFYINSSGNVAADKPNWIGDLTSAYSSSTLTIPVTANTGAARTAYFRVEKGSVKSDVITINQAVYAPTAPTLPAAGNFDYTKEITITVPSGTTVYYTTNGDTPTSSNTPYSAPFTINATTTVKAIAYDNGYPSSVVSATYTRVYETMSDITSTSGTHKVKGTVVAKNNKGFIVADHTGYMYYYQNSAPSQDINAVVEVSGNLTSYGHVIEFNSSSTVSSASSTTYTSGIPTVIDGDYMYDVLNAGTTKYRTDYQEFVGDLVKDGSNYNITVKGASNNVTARASYATDAQNSVLENLKGKTVKVRGYYAGDASSIYYVMLGSVEAVPVLTTSVTSISNFTYNVGGGPDAKSFTVAGANLTDDITVSTNSENFEISSNNSNWQTSDITISKGSGTVSATTIYVRLKSGLSSNTYSGKITVSSTGAVSKEIALTGTVTHVIAYNTSLPTGCSVSSEPNGAQVAGESVSLTATAGSGYKFTAWDVYKTGESSTEVTVTDNAFTMPSYNVTVSATFVEAYTVTYDANGGTGTLTDENSPYTSGSTVTVLDNNNNNFTRDGYDFSEWNTNDDGSGSSYDPNNTFTITANTTLYAQWSAKQFNVALSSVADVDLLASYGISSTITGGNNADVYCDTKITLSATNMTAGKVFIWNVKKQSDNSDVTDDVLDGDVLTVPAYDITIGGQVAELFVQYSGDISEGDYIITYTTGNGTTYAMKNTVSSSRLEYGTLSPSNSQIISVDASDYLWHIAPSAYYSGYWTIYNDDVSKYAASNGTDKQATLLTAADIENETKAAWSVDGSSTYDFINKYKADNSSNYKYLRSNTTSGYAVYQSSTNGANILYKKVSGSKHSVAIATGITNGSVSVSPSSAYEGQTVTLTPEPSGGYMLDSWDVYKTGDATTKITVKNNSFVMPGYDVTVSATFRVQHTYTLVDGSTITLVPGKHYLIASTNSTNYYVMGAQNGSVRSSVPATLSESKILENNDFYEVVISGDDTNNWTMYSVKDEGYLYATGAGSANINVREDNVTTNPTYGQWTISILSGTATITSVASLSYNKFTYNHNSGNNSRFACYSTAQTAVKLYVRDGDKDLEFYSPTTIASATIAADETYIVESGQVLKVTGTLTNNGTAANLIIKDGGQIILPEDASVNATVKRHVTGNTKAAAWEAFASTINNPAIGSTNLITGTYDLYMYDESADKEWVNYKAHTSYFANLTNSRGYLYRNAATMDITIEGALNTSDISDYTLSRSGSDPSIIGFNFVGNPYQMDIYKGVAISNTYLETGYYVLDGGAWSVRDDDVAIAPGAGILVQANSTGDGKKLDVTYTNASSKANHDNIMFTVGNSEYSDVTYAMFDEGHGLNKISHRNQDVPMLYIPQNDENFAIAMMNDDTKAFKLSFKAMTTGKYTLSYKAKGNFSYLHVIDRLTGEDVDMLLEGEYSFIASKQDNENRFIVRLEYSENPAGFESSTFAWQNGSDIIVNGEGELQIFDVMGRRVSTVRVSGETTITAPSMQGVYIFKLNDKTQKIVVK